MSWNYRLLRTRQDDEEVLAIHEVYYDGKGRPDSYTATPSWPSGETWEEFQKDFARYQKASLCRRKDILDERDFNKTPAAKGKA